MKPIDTASLQIATGGGRTPNPVKRLEKIGLLDATAQDIAEASIYGPIDLPTEKTLRKVKTKMEIERRGLNPSFNREWTGYSWGASRIQRW